MGGMAFLQLSNDFALNNRSWQSTFISNVLHLVSSSNFLLWSDKKIVETRKERGSVFGRTKKVNNICKDCVFVFVCVCVCVCKREREREWRKIERKSGSEIRRKEVGNRQRWDWLSEWCLQKRECCLWFNHVLGF